MLDGVSMRAYHVRHLVRDTILPVLSKVNHTPASTAGSSLTCTQYVKLVIDSYVYTRLRIRCNKVNCTDVLCVCVE